MEISGKTVIITGASSGIGEAIAMKLNELGVNLVLAARREDRLQKLTEELPSQKGKVITVKTDVTQAEDVKQLVKAAVDQFGKVDALINNAGIMPLSYLKNTKIQEWLSMVDVNIKGVLHCIAEVIPLMTAQRSGHIINISSNAGRMVFPTGAVYCATKHAINALTDGMRMELGPEFNIKITCIEPGAVKTELTQTITDSEVEGFFASDALNFDFLDVEHIVSGVVYALEQPEGVTVGDILIQSTAQPA
ncbi:MAG: SDR family oxidoreductase [Bacteroidota bacterium]